MVITLVLGILIGAVMGLTGAGGGILAVPALAAGLGWSMQQAVPVALIAVSGGAALGAFEGWRKSLVRYRAAGVIALASLPFTAVGLHLAHQLPERWLLALFALVLLFVAARLLHQTRRSTVEASSHALAHLDPLSGHFQWSAMTALLFVGIGALTGFTTGLLGVGGGFIIVPMLRRFTDVSMHGIVATSLLVIALVGTSSVLMALAHDVHLPLQSTTLFALATAVGTLLGRRVIAQIAASHVQRVFAWVLVMVALGMLHRAGITSMLA